jgi:septal ring factor EnvC (AmiA/AmiB activator)
MPDLVDREKLAIEKAGIQREINALQNRFSQDEKKFARLGREMESDKKEDRRIMKNVERLQKMLDKLKAKLTPKKKARPRKAKPKKKRK